MIENIKIIIDLMKTDKTFRIQANISHLMLFAAVLMLVVQIYIFITTG